MWCYCPQPLVGAFLIEGQGQSAGRACILLALGPFGTDRARAVRGRGDRRRAGFVFRQPKDWRRALGPINLSRGATVLRRSQTCDVVGFRVRPRRLQAAGSRANWQPGRQWRLFLDHWPRRRSTSGRSVRQMCSISSSADLPSEIQIDPVSPNISETLYHGQSSLRSASSAL